MRERSVVWIKRTDRFYASTSMHWLMLFLFGVLGGAGLTAAAMAWSGALRGYDFEMGKWLGAGLGLLGAVFLWAAAMSLVPILGGLAPIVRCYREGVEVNVVRVRGKGWWASGGVLLTLKLMWAVVSLRGFSRERVRLPWGGLLKIRVIGDPLDAVLLMEGVPEKVQPLSAHLEMERSVVFRLREGTFRRDIKSVAGAICTYANDASARERLESWGQGESGEAGGS
jgi:hypothetical protein